MNFTLLLYSSFIYGLTKLCYGTLRAVEVEQLTERAWFAITETCLAMTIFREEIGAWFLVMFTGLVTGKVWGWIGDGRVEFLEQQPPANPRLFHLRLSISLMMSFVYDVWILRYAVNTVIQQARPNMMVMFLFEFAVLATCSWRTGARYILSIAEQKIVQAQTKKRLLERRQEVRQQRESMLREREQAAAAGQDAPSDQEPLPNEDDIDEMDIEVPGWAAKGEWVLWLDLVTGKTCVRLGYATSHHCLFAWLNLTSSLDMIKLGIYIAFFFMLLRFYGLPIHIMRDLFMTSRDFIKRLNAILRYRRAIQEMNRYADATAEELSQENTCIICREEMRPWDPVNQPGAVDRIRPKKLPCGHVLHLGCLKSWLERQQVCPTCRSPVTMDRGRLGQNRAAGLRIQIGGGQNAQGQGQAGANNDAQAAQRGPNDAQAPPPQGRDGPRVFNFGPLRLGFGAGGQQARELAQQFGIPQGPGNQGGAATPTPTQPQPPAGDNMQQIGNLIQREFQNLQTAQQELQVAQLLMTELQRIRQRRQNAQNQPHGSQILTGTMPGGQINAPIPLNQTMHIPAQGNNPLGGASFLPGVPPRMGSPFLARHVAPVNTAAIPAGSPDLPEGVTLPPGWSLIPLQRLDGAQPPTQQSDIPAPGDNSNGPVATQRRPSPPADDATVGERTSSTGAGNSAPATEAAEGSSASMSTRGHAAPVVAPSPLMPNWSGSAQLFNSGLDQDPIGTAERSSPLVGDRQRQSSELQTEHATSGSAETRPNGALNHGEPHPDGSAAVDKGKGRAATVEEADGENDS